MKIELKGKVSLVTGAARGIGKSIAVKLAQSGSDVIVADLMEDEAKKTAEEISRLGVKARAISVDVSDFNSVENCVKESINAFGKIDHLINNAGVTRDTLLMRMTPQDWDFVLNINLKGVFNFTKAVSTFMMKQKSGRIVNVASIIGLIGNPGQANYSASKGGVIALTKTTAKEFAARNINCNAIAPGFIDTEMTRKLPENIREEYMKLIPLKRYGDPDEVADAVLFFVSDLSKYITGQVLVIDGGMVM
ncbi:MAG: 3-oxoacyl-[acyl-carrier-protein] reductase [Spirochaetes bacterium]|nr:3-oxoacyl-[acyl-carrier-protein] reductase [Spirochaetota bacterium]